MQVLAEIELGIFWESIKYLVDRILVCQFLGLRIALLKKEIASDVTYRGSLNFQQKLINTFLVNVIIIET